MSLPEEDMKPRDSVQHVAKQISSDGTAGADGDVVRDAELIEIAGRLDSFAWGRMPDDVRARLEDTGERVEHCDVRGVSRRLFGLASAAMLLIGVGIGWGFAWAAGDFNGGGRGDVRADMVDTNGVVLDRESPDGFVADRGGDGDVPKQGGTAARVELASVVFSRPRANASRALEPSLWGQMGARD